MQLFKVLTFTMVCSLAFNSQAAPMYYTFEGVVNWGPIDDLGINTGTNAVANGDFLQFVFEVDLARPGEKQLLQQQSSPQPVNDSRYARLVSGTRLDPSLAGLTTFDVKEENLFWTGYQGAYIHENNANIYWERTDVLGTHLVQLTKQGTTIDDYVVGATRFSVYERVLVNHVGASRYQILNALTLVDISPVPTPSALWLLAVGVLFLRRRN